MIRLAEEDERESLASIFEDGFDSALPDSRQANIVVSIDDNNEIAGCVTAEILVRTDMWWVRPDLRKTTKGVKIIRELISHLFQNIPKGASVIVISDTKRKSTLLKRLGFRGLKGTAYRLDL